MADSGVRQALVLAVVLGAGMAIGIFGSDEGDPTPVAGIFTGRADVTGDGLGGSISTPGWTYGYGLPMWTDAAGTLHMDGAPDCLPALASRTVNFAAIEVMVNGSSWRPVVWVDCRLAGPVDVP